MSLIAIRKKLLNVETTYHEGGAVETNFGELNSSCCQLPRIQTGVGAARAEHRFFLLHRGKRRIGQQRHGGRFDSQFADGIAGLDDLAALVGDGGGRDAGGLDLRLGEALAPGRIAGAALAGAKHRTALL